MPGGLKFEWHPKIKLQCDRYNFCLAVWKTRVYPDVIHRSIHRFFGKDEWKNTRKQKVFGLTTSTGASLAFLVPKPFTAEQWARELDKKVAPFLKKAFPRKQEFRLLLDGEKLLHAPAAKAAMKRHGMSTMPGWPAYSPDLNPQEHVWSWAEPALRKLEKDGDSFQAWQKKCIKAVNAYPSKTKLVGTMAKRVKKVILKKGAMSGN